MASLISSGIGSGLNIQSLVAQLVAAERAPTENRLASREALAQARISGFGGLKSALETFQESVAKLQSASLYTLVEPEAEVETAPGFSATSANTNIFTASADSTAIAGTYQVEVTRVASANRILNDQVFDENYETDNKSGQLTISVGDAGSFDVAVTAKSSLEDVALAINDQADNTGDKRVTATVVTDEATGGQRLVLAASKTGEGYDISVDSASGGGNADLKDFRTSNGGSYTQIVAAQDSEIIIDGPATADEFTYTSSSATFDDIDYLPGVTIEVVEADLNTQYDLRIVAEAEAEEVEAADPNAAVSSAISSAVNDFVKAYNTLKTTLNDLTAYDQEANTQGLLNGDPTVRAISSRLRQEISDSVSGVSKNVDTLAELGVTTNPNDGTLEVEADRLTAALDSNLADFETLFSGTDGFATRLSAVLEPYTQSAGLIDSRTDGLKSQIERIADQREALNRRIIGIEERYLRQFTALDTLLGELNNSSNFLSSQLANLPGAVPINKN